MNSSRFCLGWATRRTWLHRHPRRTTTALSFSPLLHPVRNGMISYRSLVSKIYMETDEQGRTIRKRPSNDDSDGAVGERRRGGGGGNSSDRYRNSKSAWGNDNDNSNHAESSRSPRKNENAFNDDDDNEPIIYNQPNDDDDDDDDKAWNDSPRRGRPSQQQPPPRRNAAPKKAYGDSWQDRPRRRDGRSSSSSPSSSTRYGAFSQSSGSGGGSDYRRRSGDYNNNNNNNINNRWKEASNDAFTASPSSLLGKTNMKALEGAGFVHLYGLASCLNALRASRRELSEPEEWKDRIEQLQQPLGNTRVEEEKDDYSPYTDDDSSRKPEAQFRPWLFVQEQQPTSSSSSRSNDKVQMADQILRLAKERNVPVAYVDRGVLNTLSGNRPHQGYVLRCGKLSFEPLSRIPLPSSTSSDTNITDTDTPWLWLVLDEVVDPQNLGALVRTAYFLGSSIGILVCAKNSAPPSAVVSAASAGALEVATIYSTINLPRTLQQAQQDGFRILGASSSPPPQPRSRRSSGGAGDEQDEEANTLSPPVYDLHELPIAPSAQSPTLLVLGSEGHGLRTLVARACTEFVRIPSGNNKNTDDDDDDDEVGDESVDSLNVSVTGGILLWHLLRQR